MDIAKVKNEGIRNRLYVISKDCEKLGNRVLLPPNEVNLRTLIALDAAILAESFLDQQDLWEWIDFEKIITLDDYEKVKDVVYVPYDADFKVVFAQPIYACVIATWLAAIDLDCGGDIVLIQSRYGDKLRRHIAQNRVRPNWQDFAEDPGTPWPEKVMHRINCYGVAQHPIADRNRQCVIRIQCDNRMERKTHFVRDVSLLMDAGPSVSCTFPPNLGDFDAEEIAHEQGVHLFTLLADMLEKVLLSGSLRQEHIGWFGSTPTQNVAWIYAVAQNGELSWYKQTPTDDPNVLGQWIGPETVGIGWDIFTSILPAGGCAFYGVMPDGELRWHRHNGFNDGSPDWSGPKTVGSGWNGFKAIVPGSDGVLYAIQPDGTLLWYRDLAFLDGGADWRGPLQVGTSWQTFKTVFSVTGGILYAVADDGRLLWYRHKGFEDGSPDWEGPYEVGTGWQNFRSLFGEWKGVIYAVRPDGAILWYRHDGWETGNRDAWTGPVVAATGFVGQRQFFPLMSATIIAPPH